MFKFLISYKQKMKKLLKAIIICLLQTQIISHFFHFDNFLQPIVNPLTEKLIKINHKNSDTINVPMSDPSSQIDISQQKNSKKKPINRSNQDFYGRKKDERYNMRAEDYLAKDLYEMIGIPQDIVYSKIIPIHMEARYHLNCYFYKGSNAKHKLYQTLLELKQIINWVFDNYLKKYKSLIVGSENTVLGSHIFLFADKHTIIGNQNIVFNTQYPEQIMRGDDIVRISRFDVNLEKLERVLINPYDAISLLQE